MCHGMRRGHGVVSFQYFNVTCYPSGAVRRGVPVPRRRARRQRRRRGRRAARARDGAAAARLRVRRRLLAVVKGGGSLCGTSSLQERLLRDFAFVGLFERLDDSARLVVGHVSSPSVGRAPVGRSRTVAARASCHRRRYIPSSACHPSVINLGALETRRWVPLGRVRSESVWCDLLVWACGGAGTTAAAVAVAAARGRLRSYVSPSDATTRSIIIRHPMTRDDSQ